MAFTYVTVEAPGGYLLATGDPATGRVRFTPTAAMHNDATTVATPVEAHFGADGLLALQVAANTDPATEPAGVAYRVDIEVRGQAPRRFFTTISHDGGSTVDLADLDELAEPPALVAPLRTIRAASDYDDTADPATGQAIVWDGTHYAPADVATDATDATTGTKGVARILGGTADAPTVPYTSVTGRPTLAAVATSGSASDITTGTLPDGQIPSGIARDSEVTSAVSTHAAASDPHGDRAYTDTQVAGRQPLDADLTTIAGLTATTDSILQSKASAWTTRTPAQFKTDLSLTKSDVGLGNVDNTADTAKPVSTAQQTSLDGKQPLDSDLTTIAGLTATTDNFLQAKSSAWASRTPTQVAADLVTPLSSSLQPIDSDLTAIAALTPTNDDVVQRKAGAWTNRTPAQLKSDLALTKSDVGLGNVTNNAQVTGVTAGDATITIGGTSAAPTVAVAGSTFQPLDSDLTTIAGLTATTDNFLQAKSSAWASRTPAQVGADLASALLDARYGLAVHAVGNSGTSLTIDASSSSGPVKTITLTGNCTITLTGATSGQATMLELVLTQDGTGSRTITWPASVKWASGSAPTLTTTASAVDRIVLVSYNGGTTWYGDVIGKAYA